MTKYYLLWTVAALSGRLQRQTITQSIYRTYLLG